MLDRRRFFALTAAGAAVAALPRMALGFAPARFEALGSPREMAQQGFRALREAAGARAAMVAPEFALRECPMLKLSAFLLAACAALPVHADWQLDNESSRLSFISTKATHITEVNRFRGLRGSVEDDGKVRLRLLKKADTFAEAIVEVPGEIKDRKGYLTKDGVFHAFMATDDCSDSVQLVGSIGDTDDNLAVGIAAAHECRTRLAKVTE